MTESSEIQQLRDEIHELRLLYRRLAEAIIPEEKATPEDVESVEAPGETVTKEEFLLALEEAPVRCGGRVKGVSSPCWATPAIWS